MKKNKDLKLHSANITATVYFNADNGFFIGKTDEGFSVKASNVVMPILGEAIIYGGFEVDPKYGRQLVAHKIFFKDPNQAVKMLVSSGFLTGIKSHKAAELFVTLGKRIFEVLDKAIEDPEALMVWNGKNMLPKEVLCTVKGIGPVVADQIIASYAKKKSRLGVSILSVQAGLTMRQYLNALSIIGPDKLTEWILREPYSLSTISHFDWETVDLIAQLDWEGKEPIPHDSATRLSAALREAINIEYKNGHMACPFDKAIAVAEDLANTVGLWEIVKPRVTNEGMICYKNKDNQKMITLTHLFEMERESAKRIVELRNAKPKFAPPPSNLEISNFSDLTLAPEQDEAIQAALTNNVTIITGGPGTGKTTILKTLIRIFRKHDITFTLCAPTGKAAVRMEEATDERAATLHREFQFFKPDRSDWIFCETNYLIVDEASMLSADLFHNITEIIHPGQRLILLGDADQLPPVGPGEVLIQMMQTEKTVRLKHIYRQSKNSGIIVAAHDINNGKYPENDSDNGFILEHARSQNAVAKVLDWIEKLGQDTMILTPVNKGPVGREFLNRVLQDRFNPVGERVPGTFFRVGDKVIQTKNDYNIDVMNGEIGVITEIVNGSGDFSIDNDNVVMRIFFERREKETRITKSQTDNVQLAYALTIHKTQGSQYDNVIVLMPPVYHEFFLRQLPYTGITRGASTVVAIDIDRNMDRYIKNEKKLRRVSILSDLISAAEEYETTDHPE